MNVIGINTLFLIPNEVGGTEYYTRSFLNSLSCLDSTNTYVLFCNRENADTFELPSPRWRKVICPVYARNRMARILYEQCVLPFLALRHGCTLLHSFGYIGPILPVVPYIVTVHDANWLDCPEDVSLASRLVQGVLTPLCMLSAAGVVTDSAFGKQRLLHYFPFITSKIHVIQPWVDRALLKAMHQVTGQKKQTYVLCVSGMYPHKRVSYGIELFIHMQKRTKNLHLIVVGRNGADEASVRLQLADSPNTTYFPTVSRTKLASLYVHASLFLFPSVYEGFGYPVYEAIAAGVPTVVGKRLLYDGKIQDMVGELTFDPENDVNLCLNMMKRPHRTASLPKIAGDTSRIHELLSLYSSL